MTRPDSTVGDVTVSWAVPTTPSQVAEMVIGPPTATPVTVLPLTVAMAGLPDDQITGARPTRMLPAASFRTASKNPFWLTFREVGPLTVIVAIGGPVTVIGAEPLWNSMVAVMVTGP